MMLTGFRPKSLAIGSVPRNVGEFRSKLPGSPRALLISNELIRKSSGSLETYELAMSSGGNHTIIIYKEYNTLRHSNGYLYWRYSDLAASIVANTC